MIPTFWGEILEQSVRYPDYQELYYSVITSPLQIVGLTWGEWSNR